MSLTIFGDLNHCRALLIGVTNMATFTSCCPGPTGMATNVDCTERSIVEVPLTAAWEDSPALGCHPGDCRYLEEQLWARAKNEAALIQVR